MLSWPLCYPSNRGLPHPPNCYVYASSSSFSLLLLLHPHCRVWLRSRVRRVWIQASQHPCRYKTGHPRRNPRRRKAHHRSSDRGRQGSGNGPRSGPGGGGRYATGLINPYRNRVVVVVVVVVGSEGLAGFWESDDPFWGWVILECLFVFYTHPHHIFKLLDTLMVFITKVWTPDKAMSFSFFV